MSGEVFVDTTVLIYAHDVDAGEKHEVAAGIVRGLWETHTGALSTQVLQEFYVNVTRKIPKPVRKSVARDLIAAYATWRSVQIEVTHVLAASEIEERHRISFWDALIVAAARASGAATLLSEDLGHGGTIAGIRVENPFR